MTETLEGQHMEEIARQGRLVYKPVSLVAPEEVMARGVVTGEIPVSGPSFVKDGLVFRAGEEVKREDGDIYGFPDVETALAFEGVLSYGFYRGFIAFGEGRGRHVIGPITNFPNDRKTRSEKMHVAGFQAFVDGSEIKEGYIGETVRDQRTHLIVLSKEEQRNSGVDRIRYEFRIDESGEALFQEIGPSGLTHHGIYPEGE
jgi:hypothetical protein